MSTVADLLSNQINDYYTWKSCNDFYKSRKHTVDITEFCKLPCFHYKDIESINNCTSNTVVIQNMAESIRSIEYFRQYNKNKHYVIFSGGSWNPDKHDIGIQSYELVTNWFFLVEMIDTYMSPHRFNFYLDKLYNFDGDKKYVFCSLVGNKRPERDIFVNKLLNNITYDDYILRYSGQDLASPADNLDVVGFVKGEFDPYTPLIQEHYHHVGQTLPIKMYNSCQFNIVVETDIDYTHSFFITEKTVKCLLSGMPFLIVATPFFLKTLRDNGFLTYNTLWDESYDSIVDTESRANALVELANQLKNFDWIKHRQKLQHIAEHNLRNLLNSDKIVNKFYTNFETAVENFERRC